MTDTGAGWKPALLRMPVDLDSYGICLRLYCGFFGAGGGGRAGRAWRWGAGVAPWWAAVLGRGGGGFGGGRRGSCGGGEPGAGGGGRQGSKLHWVGTCTVGGGSG